ncbi:MAG: aspartyl-tRNA(Asn)/glutamyl-tRNA(Gln) amidotransferase subunit [Abditibacteriota bacterium]|nr:aspartyl-tRNA(Asn)/glutamyl-tRNA(Gln) amidotransferase subunit [Abditibacteriota bacterium]
MSKYEIVIGMEVHAELLTQSKQFCACPNEAVAPPNTNVCPVCLGFPGSLPVLNAKSVDLSLRTVLAFDSKINTRCIFERKNYFYPDLPKAYQVSQRLLPLGEGGFIDIDVPNGDGTSTVKRVGLHDVHMEEDTGKSQHGESIGDPDSSLIDFNRSGIPLLEIVSLPDMRSVEEAEAYMTALRQLLLYLEVSDCKMELGRLRFEASLSLRPWGQEEYGTRVEVKNLNSMKAVRDSLRAEIERQTRILDSGGVVVQQTMLWDEASGTTQPMRSKEQAHDYRYFPEPDLVPLDIDSAWLERVRASMPELPRAKNQRFIEQLGLSSYEAGVLTSSREIAEYYEAALEGYTKSDGGAAKAISNWVCNELLGRVNAQNSSIAEAKVLPAQLRELVQLIDAGTISGKIAKEIFDEMFTSGRDAKSIVEERGLTQMSDTTELEAICEKVIAANPKAVEDYRGGKEKSFGALVGGVMKETKGRANPALVNELLKKALTQ